MDLFSGQLQELKKQLPQEQRERLERSGEHILRHLPETDSNQGVVAEIYDPSKELDIQFEYACWLMEGIKAGVMFEDLDENDQAILRSAFPASMLPESIPPESVELSAEERKRLKNRRKNFLKKKYKHPH